MAKDIFPTEHLREKMQARLITWADIVEVNSKPDVVYGPDERGSRVLQRGDLSIVVDKNGNVITALLRQEDQWTDEDARKRNN